MADLFARDRDRNGGIPQAESDEYYRILADGGRIAAGSNVPDGYEAAAPGSRTDTRTGVTTHLPANVTWAGGRAPALGSMGTSGGGYGGVGTGTGFGGSGASYALPGSDAASQAMRGLQMGAMSGLQGLMSRDTTASRKAIQDALYEGQAEGINTAADRSRMAMLEGTFGRGVGSSTITTELYGRGEQERGDALARALREAFTQAGSEDRADLASESGLYGSAFGAATTGLQGEANVALANLAREQQESQFSRNMGFQGSENAANRAQSSAQFGQNLGLSYAQLGQQSSENAANRAFTGGENAANRATTISEAELNRQLQQLMLENQQEFSAGQAGLNREFTAGQTTSGQAYTAEQNRLSREQQMQQILLQIANSQEIAGNRDLGLGISAAGSGVGALLGPMLAEIAKGW